MSNAKTSNKPGKTKSSTANASAVGNIKGEGDYESAKRFNDAETAFVKSGKVQKAAGKAAPESTQVANEIAQAEQSGRARAKGVDPQVSKPAKIEPKVQSTKTICVKKPTHNDRSGIANHFAGADADDNDDIASAASGNGPTEGNTTTAHATEAAHEFALSEKSKRGGQARAKASPSVSGRTGSPRAK